MSEKDLVVRKVVRSDAETLLSLLIDSNSSLKLTRSRLERDLACADELELIDTQQELDELNNNHHATTLELDLKLVKSNVPALQGFLAEISSNGTDRTNWLAGLVLYHYFYSPWSGHRIFINYIYVRPEHRNKGIATQLLEELRLHCKQEGISNLLYETSQIPEDLMTRIAKHGMRLYRGDATDWSVFRFNFD